MSIVHSPVNVVIYVTVIENTQLHFFDIISSIITLILLLIKSDMTPTKIYPDGIRQNYHSPL